MHGDVTKLEDLTTHQKLLLRVLAEEPETKHIGLCLRDCNIMAAIGVAKYAGNMKFELTPLGIELYAERLLFFQGTREEETSDIGDLSQKTTMASKTCVSG